MRNGFPVTVHIIFVRNNEILLMRRANTGYQDGNYGVVAGHIDGGETIYQASIREIKEEVGVDIHADDLCVVGVMHRMEGDERVDLFLVVEDWSGDLINAEPEKCDEIQWFPVNQLPVNTIPYVRCGIELTRSTEMGMWFETFGWESTG